MIQRTFWRCNGKWMLAATSGLATLLLLEAAFAFWITPSDGFAMTLSGRRWFARHWKPINAHGFRDREHPQINVPDERVIFLVGDSFVAGHGIDRTADRFSDRLQKQLGARTRVVVLAQCGWSTTPQQRALEEQTLTPDVVLLVHFVNDIEVAAALHGRPIPEFRPTLPLPFRVSHLLNFLYWRMYRSRPREISDHYWTFIRDAYADPVVLNAHRAEIDRMRSWAEAKGARFAIAWMPHLLALEETHLWTEPLRRGMSEMGVQQVDLSELFRGKEPAELVVNPTDAHLHRNHQEAVANALLPLAKP